MFFFKSKKQETKQPETKTPEPQRPDVSAITVNFGGWTLTKQQRLDFIQEQLSFIHGITAEAKTALIKKCMSKDFDDMNFFEFNSLFEKYFNFIAWTWDEYEFFRKHGYETGIYPCLFKDPFVCDVESVTIDNIFDNISLPKAKKALELINVDPPKKQVKKSIVDMAKTNSAIETALLNVYYHDRQEFIFFEFIRSLRYRLRSYDDIVKFSGEKWKITAAPENEELVKLGQKAGFTKYSPFVPCGFDTVALDIKIRK